MRPRPRLLLAVVAAWLALAAGDGWRETEREFRAVGALLAVPPAELQAACDAEAAADALEAASFPPGLDTQALAAALFELEAKAERAGFDRLLDSSRLLLEVVAEVSDAPLERPPPPVEAT